ncbi:MAG: patatin-like phospholipase family protein [Bacteroidales bacterium]|nr:patatin-like phospholipase family protein [Bacteroidales bacterium]
MKRFLVIIAIGLLTFSTLAQDTIVSAATDTIAPAATDTTATVSHRPKVGVVLSGGGAKGFAHIGALRVIEEAGIPIDYIAGTSMGSIIGGLYAVGYDPDMMQKLCTEQDWNLIMKDQIPRRFIPIEKRINERHYLVTLPYKKGQLKIKRSLIDGMYVNMLLTRLTMPAYKQRDFSQLPVPFLCIGTDMITADPIEFTSGSLAQSIRSSMSIPFLFEPVDYQGHLLCDGGLTNNFPVQNVRAKGADIIIGVDLEIIKSDPEVLDNSLKVLERLIAVVSQDKSNVAREECDILIRPQLGKANMMSFNDFSPIINCGEEGAREKFPELKRLADSLQALGPFEVERHHTQPVDRVMIAGVDVEGLDEYNTWLLKSEFGTEFPHEFLIEEIETIIVKIYSTGYYSNVWYELTDTPEGNIIQLHCKNRTSLNFSVAGHYDNNYGIGLLLNMNARTKHYTYNIDLNIAENPYFRAGITHRYTRMLSGTAEVSALNLKVNYYYPTGKIYDQVRYQRNAFNLYFQVSPTVTQAIKFGVKANYSMAQEMQYIPDMEDEVAEHVFKPEMYCYYFFNNEDQTDFPTRGWNVTMIGRAIMYDGVFSDADSRPYFTVQGNIRKSFPIGQRHAFRLGAAGAMRLGPMMLDFDDQFFIGGQSKMYYLDNLMRFTGLPFVSIMTEYAAYAKTAWQWNFYKNFYAVANCDAGYFRDFITMNIWEFMDNYFNEGYKHWFEPDYFIMGAGLTLGYKTPLGPIELELSKSNYVDKWNLFVNVGYWF